MKLELDIKSRKQFIGKILNISNASDYLTALTEWTFQGKFKVPKDVAKIHCLCGQPIINCFVFRNYNTRESIHVGCECKDKFVGLDRRFCMDSLTDLLAIRALSGFEFNFLRTFTRDGGGKSLRDMTPKQSIIFEQIVKKLARVNYYDAISRAQVNSVLFTRPV